MIKKMTFFIRWMAWGTAVLLFCWFVLLKLVARIAAQFGQSAPCPAALGWIVNNPLRRRYMKPVLGWIGIEPGEKVLELGPGPGVFTVAAARQAGPSGQVVAVDIQPEMIAQVEQRVQAAGLTNVETHVANAHHLPLADHSIDRAFLVSVLPEIPDPAQALAELRRVLRPEGILSITSEFADPDYLFAGELVQMLEQAGFTLVEQYGNWWCYTANFVLGQGETIGSSYYVVRQHRLQRQFDAVVRRARPLLSQHYGMESVDEIAEQAETEFAGLIPQLPYIGGRSNPLTFNLVGSAWFLALYQPLQEQGKSVDEIGMLIQELYELWLDRYPDWLLRLRGWWGFTPVGLWLRGRRARLSQERRHSGDWVFTMIPKNGHDFGVDYIECGILKFYEAQGATELMPYLCRTDFIMSERMGLGLARTTTLAEGHDRCNFRCKRSGVTKWPPGTRRERPGSLPAEALSLLRDPATGEPLRLHIEPGANGRLQEWLVAESNDNRFPIRNGIPEFVQPADVTGSNRRFRFIYHWSAPLYDFFVRLYSLVWGGNERKWRQEFLRELAINPGDKVLEVSVGTGGNLRLLPDTAHYFGLDLTPGMLKQCQRNLRRWRRQATLFLGNGEQLPFADESFDIVYHVGGINFFNDPGTAIQEMVRVAKPGTRLMIVDETEKGVSQYEKMPGFRLLFRGERQPAQAPIDQVPATMQDISVSEISRGAFYRLTFRKPERVLEPATDVRLK